MIHPIYRTTCFSVNAREAVGLAGKGYVDGKVRKGNWLAYLILNVPTYVALRFLGRNMKGPTPIGAEDNRTISQSRWTGYGFNHRVRAWRHPWQPDICSSVLSK